VQVSSEVFDTFVGQGPVVVSPGVLFVNVSSGLEGLASLDDHEVGHFGKLVVLWRVEIFLGDHDTILEQGGVDCFSGCFRDEHDEELEKF